LVYPRTFDLGFFIVNGFIGCYSLDAAKLFYWLFLIIMCAMNATECVVPFFRHGRMKIMSTMPTEMFQKLRRSLIKHEGYENKPYVDTVGKITIGCGYNLSDRGIGNDVIESWLLSDISYFNNQLSVFSWFGNLCEDRRIALIDMSFMGFKKLLEFKEMLAALAKNDFNTAADEMLKSEWATQVKSRATDLAQVIRNGIYDV
jgi:lysozyme